MKQKLFIFVFLILLAVVLIGLNAASYTQKPKESESEFSPNRSTYNTGATGTQAFYSLLSETGRSVVRWQQPPDKLARKAKNSPSTLVLIGPIRREFAEAEITSLVSWVASGGKLVVIDRDPPVGLQKTLDNWKLEFVPSNALELFAVDPSDTLQMTAKTAVAKPVQPTLLTASVSSVQPSQFASSIKFTVNATDDSDVTYEMSAPIEHLSSEGKSVLVDLPYYNGRIVYLSDPFIVSNAGISLVDNAQLAINIVSADDGVIAFDEFHQGFGSNKNQIVQFFAGTPIVAIFFQCAALVAFIFYSQGRRFARALPDAEPDRLSKLEYVAAMAELQQRTRAYDLAIENIYRDFRRRASRLLGVDNGTVGRGELARLVAERSGLDLAEIDKLLFKCEDIIHGEPTHKSEVVALTRRLREIEAALGMRRRTGK